MEEELLHGGVANAGAVVRQGSHVLRPSNRHAASIHRALSPRRSTGFLGASNPVGIEAEGRERLEFIDGDVPFPPYPEWARSDVTDVADDAGGTSAVRSPTGMFEMSSCDDVGAAFDRVWDSPLDIPNGLGRHDDDGCSASAWRVRLGFRS